MSNGVNISGPYIETIPPPLQIISMGSIDLKTVPVILVRNLWRPREIGEVSPRAPHRGPTTRSVTATFAHAHERLSRELSLSKAIDYGQLQTTLPRTRYEGACGIARHVRARLQRHARLTVHAVHAPA